MRDTDSYTLTHTQSEREGEDACVYLKDVEDTRIE